MPESSEPVPIGTLVKIVSQGSHYVGRVDHRCLYTSTIYVLANGYEGEIVETYDTPKPECISDLTERRGLLLELIRKTVLKLDDRCYAAPTVEKRQQEEQKATILRKFLNHVFAGGSAYRNNLNHFWFWSWVAVSADNPRHLSYSWEEQWVDTDARRKHSSVSTFLKSAVHKGLCSFTEDEIRTIAECIGEYFPNTLEYTFRVVSGAAVCTAYRESDPEWKSCMTAHADDYVRWYAENPSVVSCLRIHQGDQYVGRALLWNTEQGVTVLDRIYPSDGGPHTAAAEGYAAGQGWDYRTNHRCDRAQFHSRRVEYTVTMARPLSGNYPYMDSFAFTNDCPKSADTLTLNCRSGDVEFQEIDGSWEGAGGGGGVTECSSCACELDEDTSCYSEGGDGPYCVECYSDRYIYVTYHANGRWVDTEAHRDDVTECDECSEYRLDEHVYRVEDRNVCVCCVEDCVTSCERCNAEFLTDNAQEFDGQTLCCECYDAIPECDSCGDKCAEDDMKDGHCPDCVEEENGEEDAKPATDGGETSETETAQEAEERTYPRIYIATHTIDEYGVLVSPRDVPVLM